MRFHLSGSSHFLNSRQFLKRQLSIIERRSSLNSRVMLVGSVWVLAIAVAGWLAFSCLDPPSTGPASRLGMVSDILPANDRFVDGEVVDGNCELVRYGSGWALSGEAFLYYSNGTLASRQLYDNGNLMIRTDYDHDGMLIRTKKALFDFEGKLDGYTTSQHSPH